MVGMRAIVVLALAAGCAWTNRGPLIQRSPQAQVAQQGSAQSDAEQHHEQRGREMRATLAGYENDPAYVSCRAKLADPATAPDEHARCLDFYARWTNIIETQRALIARHDDTTADFHQRQAIADQQENAESRRAMARAVQAAGQQMQQSLSTPIQTTTNCRPDGIGGVRCVSQ